MNKTLKIIFIIMILMIATDAISHAISGDPIANVKQKAEDLSGVQNLLTLSYRTTSIGPFQSVSIKFQQTENNKTISAIHQTI